MFDAQPKRRKLSPPFRINRKNDFLNIFRTGKCVKGERLNIWINKKKGSPGRSCKLSIITTRKVSLSAVKRNLWKRRIREIFRKEQKQIDSGFAIIIKVKPGQSRVASSSDLKEEILLLLRQAQVVDI